MQYYYYINSENLKDGPHDMITIMRRIRAGTITPDTLVCMGEELVPAHKVGELSQLFNHSVEDIRSELNDPHKLSIDSILKKGWIFTSENQNMPVFAGTILLMTFIAGVITSELMHSIASGLMAGWITFIVLQSMFMAVSIRVYRGQKIDSLFIERNVIPMLAKLALISVLFSLLIILGLPLLIIPSSLALLVCCYIPMFLVDYNSGIIKATQSAFSLVRKLGSSALFQLCFLAFFYMICIVLIFPIPIIMPVLAGGLCSIYEEITSA